MTSNITRRATVAAFLAGALMIGAVPAKADWHDQFKELNFGISSSENERDAVARYDAFAAYMTKKLGVPVHVIWGTDYAAVFEALHSNKIQFATIGAANYALGRKVMGNNITAVATSEDNFGSTGYHSVIVVKADSPYQKIDDLRGKVLAWADPNSTSGYAVPLYFMKKSGIDPSTFFSKTPFSGSHELGVVGVVNGTFDAAADDWTNPQKSNAQRMESKGMVGIHHEQPYRDHLVSGAGARQHDRHLHLGPICRTWLSHAAIGLDGGWLRLAVGLRLHRRAWPCGRCDMGTCLS
ncbi:phosphate/phosphite/phosphonate ABC transporter substrate-binding protein [Neorhizobium sp. P12A]|nr:phosphate/phosphite/phosphonate ABC transporter substrate-binding protein [Neorhizobium sp. P12A]